MNRIILLFQKFIFFVCYWLEHITMPFCFQVLLRPCRFYIYIALTTIIGISNIHAQTVIDTYTNVTPPAPTAATLGSYGQVPVGMFTGTARFSIPLYQLKTHNLTLPISLEYSSNGVKVDKVASWVGMDWSLNAGGVITRTIRDNADEIGTRITFENIINNEKSTWEQIVMDPGHTNIDTEPDLYAFNFNGFSGKFIIGLDGIPRLIPFQDLSIEIINVSSGGRNFIITTKDGVKYYFGENGVIESSSTLTGSCNTRPAYANAWYLTRIVHPTGDQITLSYKQNTVFYKSHITQTLTTVDQNSILNCSDCSNLSDQTTCFSSLQATTWHLDTISTDNIDIIFETSDRSDHDDWKLDAIRVREKGFSNSERHFEFTYKYSDNDHHNNNLTENENQFHSRMFLIRVEESSPGKRPKAHSFSYYDIDALPARCSFSQDHWGYYNGANNYNNFLHVPDEVSQYFTNYTAADREPNAGYAIYGLLKTINYPTGGSSEIAYEAHTYHSNNTNVETGGLRVKRITTKKRETAQAEIVRYYYASLDSLSNSSGIEPEIPGYFSSSNRELACGGDPLLLRECITYTLSSNGTNIYNISGYHIAYHTVIKSYGENFENGGEYYKYVATKDIPGALFIGQDHIQGATYTNAGWNAGMLLEQGIFKKESSGDFTILQKEEYVYNNNTDMSSAGFSDRITAAVVRQHTFPYNNDQVYVPCTEANINPIQIGYECTTDHRHHLVLYPFFHDWRCNAWGANNEPVYYNCPCSGHNAEDTVLLVGLIDNYDVMSYDIIVDWPYLKTKTVTQYDEQGNNPLVSVTNYSYDNILHAQLTKTTNTNSNGKITENINYYPLDYSEGTENFDTLTQDYIIGVPVDIRVYVDSVLTSGQLIKYNNLGQPLEVFMAQEELGTDPAFDTLNAYSYGVKRLNLSYENGNLKTSNKEDDIKTVYIWGYNNSLPVVKAVNTTQSALLTAVNTAVSAVPGSYSTLEDLLSGIQNMSQSTQRDSWSTFNDTLRSDPGLLKAEVTTYTYDPLIGMTSMTDPAGVTTYYRYDDFGRLIQSEDLHEKIREKYAYNYREVPELEVSPKSLTPSASANSDLHAMVTSNIKWTTSISYNDGSGWISVSPANDSATLQLTISVTENTVQSQRSGTVTVSDDSGSGLANQSIFITQDGIVPSITLSKYLVNLYGSYDDDNVDVTSNVAWSWYVDYYDDYGWLSVHNVAGSGHNGTLQISSIDVPPYGETWHAEIEVSGSGITKYISVYLSN